MSGPRSGWQGIVPNTAIQPLPIQKAPFTDGSSPYGASLSAASSYSMQSNHIRNPGGEHAAELSGLTTPLHHAAEVKKVNTISPPLPSDDQQTNGNQILNTRRSSTGEKSYE